MTALKNYVNPGDKIQPLQIYLAQLSISDKQGTSVLQTPSIEKTPTRDHGKTPSVDQTYWEEKTPLQSETPSKVKTPLRNKPKVNCTPGSTSDRSKNESTPAPPKRLRRRRETQNQRTMCDVMSDELFSDNEEASGGNKAGPDFTPSDDETSNEESMETKIKVNPTMRERYIHSLKSYRKYQPSVEEVKATALFHHLEKPLTKKALYAMLQKSKLNLDGPSMKRIYSKNRFACHEYLTCLQLGMTSIEAVVECHGSMNLLSDPSPYS